ncbi:hypothetical protein [Thermaerobacter subterraneus]|uniref:Uncharacterized protein n=1 Tax=Thermaerobacter subterraneus DSM 13965 TaxID=867903 RepID=K6QE49_9FIRM|nr:hypothetical protein [Thermaerobacter subterraneus]EKP95036.1 hypothetical protein ThesuDRAFT_00762 [Thermaerobacter subterraneus DSM 13965]
MANLAFVHGFLGPIVFAFAVMRVIWTGYRLLAGRDLPAHRLVGGLSVGLFDLQALLGIILLVTLGFGTVGWQHPALMLAAAVLAHMSVAAGRRVEGRAPGPFVLALISVVLVTVAYPAP